MLQSQSKVSTESTERREQN